MAKAFFYVGLFICLTGFAVYIWGFKNISGAGFGGEFVSSIELRPGEKFYKRGYIFYLEGTVHRVTLSMDKGVSYRLNITKVYGDWNFVREGVDGDVLTIVIPETGVYMWEVSFSADPSLDDAVLVAGTEVIESRFGGDIYRIPALLTVLLGLVLMFCGFLIRRL